MNWIDILLLLILVFSAWGGMQKGFAVAFFNLVALVGSVLSAYFLYPYLANWIEQNFSFPGAWIRPGSFILIMLVSRILIGTILNIILATIPAEAHQNSINRLLGVLPGLVNGIINAIVVSALLLALPISENISEKTRESRIAGRLSGPAEWLESKISPVFDEAVRRNMNKLTVEPGSEESVKLPFTVSNPRPRADLEERMLELVNQEREKEGLKPLVADPEMLPVARAHSQDMFARGYFAHVTPDGKGPFDRMRDGGIRYRAAGENLALAQTLAIAHQGLMNSPGHRKNILRPDFGRLGIGILDGGIHGLMVTQKFRD